MGTTLRNPSYFNETEAYASCSVIPEATEEEEKEEEEVEEKGEEE